MVWRRHKGKPIAVCQRALFALFLFGATLTGCSAVQQRIAEWNALRAVMQPGHSYKSYSISDESMASSVPKNSIAIADESAYKFESPKRGDIVLLWPPTPVGAPFIKRIVAVPGDTFQMLRGTVRVNGTIQKETYLSEKAAYSMAVRGYGIFINYGGGWERLAYSDANVPPKSAWVAADKIPKGFFLVFGDNRNDSEDSHIWGFAQDAGRFASGPRAGQPAFPFFKVVTVMRPTNR